MDIFFLHSGITGEGFSAENLHYFYFIDSHVRQGTIENVQTFTLQNLNADKSKELIIQSFKNLKAEDYICRNQKSKINFDPIIYEFRNDRFMKNSKEILLKEYFLKFEGKLEKKIKKRTFSNLVLYYFLSRKFSQKNKFYDLEVSYSCSDSKTELKHDFKKIKFSQFLKKYSKQIF